MGKVLEVGARVFRSEGCRSRNEEMPFPFDFKLLIHSQSAVAYSLPDTFLAVWGVVNKIFSFRSLPQDMQQVFCICIRTYPY